MLELSDVGARDPERVECRRLERRVAECPRDVERFLGERQRRPAVARDRIPGGDELEHAAARGARAGVPYELERLCDQLVVVLADRPAIPREGRDREGRLLPFTGLQEAIDRGLELGDSRIVRIFGEDECTTETEEERRIRRVTADLECAGCELSAACRAVERPGPITRLAQCRDRRGSQIVDGKPGEATELDRRLEMMRERLGAILGPIGRE